MIVPDSSEEGKCPGLESFRELRQLNVRMLYSPGLSNALAFGSLYNLKCSKTIARDFVVVCWSFPFCLAQSQSVLGVSGGRFSKWVACHDLQAKKHGSFPLSSAEATAH